ncbi:CapA family protein [Jatrophihabitans sp.]|uniref:CapA family protein n=1 Tax=Jatrophihabitans sp. TaxID=1932789 RepID=UPI002BC71C52|nr:CapA family protein [Jatrophihabitans sp.]
MTGDPVRLLCVGDVFFDRPAGMGDLSGLRELLATGDIVFGNCEGNYSDSSQRSPHARGPQIAAPTQLGWLAELGFSVMSVANNHIVDGGHEGLRQTLTRLTELGIRTAGAGENLVAAAEPAVLAAGGLRVAVIAASSVFPVGYEARPGVAGLLPLRAYTFYLNPTPDEWNPGMQPRVITAIDENDSSVLEAAISAAREHADVVVASIHWGDVTKRHGLTDHEPQAAQLLAEAGADLVLGHHQHTVRGTSFIGATPVFFGLGHVACDLPRLAEDLAAETEEVSYSDEAACQTLFGDYGIYPRADYPLLPFHPDSRFTVVGRCDLTAGGVESVGMYPCWIGPDGSVDPLAATDPRVADWLRYLVESMAALPEPATVVPGTDGALAYWQLVPASSP